MGVKGDASRTSVVSSEARRKPTSASTSLAAATKELKSARSIHARELKEAHRLRDSAQRELAAETQAAQCPPRTPNHPTMHGSSVREFNFRCLLQTCLCA